MSDKTLQHYNVNAESFAANTVAVDFSQIQQEFLSTLPPGANILDFGCGSGRDTKYFLEQGYKVDAIDGSPMLCKLASTHRNQSSPDAVSRITCERKIRRHLGVCIYFACGKKRAAGYFTENAQCTNARRDHLRILQIRRF